MFSGEASQSLQPERGGAKKVESLGEASQSLQPERGGAKKVESLGEASQTYKLPDIFSISSLHLKEDIKREVESLTKEFLNFAKEEGKKPYGGRIPNYTPLVSEENVKIMIQVLVNNSRIFFLPLLNYIKEISKKQKDDQDQKKTVLFSYGRRLLSRTSTVPALCPSSIYNAVQGAYCTILLGS
ncbi:MAG: hypothetical protein AAGF04_05320 [Chlamydiota bacterium]